jgi:thioredoxin 1
MSVRAIKALSEFTTTIASAQLTVVDFTATWCGPCKMIAPKFDQLATEKPFVQFVKVDVDAAPEIARTYQIQAMPTFMFFKNGAQVHTFQGADWNQLTATVDKLGTAPPPPIPSDEVLSAMPIKELLALMKARHIDASGLPEKQDLVNEIKKYR